MAQFYGEVTGTRRTVTTVGHKTQGMTAHIRGWDIGVKIILKYEDGRDVIYIYETEGSNGDLSSKLIKKIMDGKK